MAGPPIPTVVSFVALMTSQQPSNAALPAKQRPDTMPTSGTSPASWANCPKVGTSRPATPSRSVSPGRPPRPAPLGDRLGSILVEAEATRRAQLREVVPDLVEVRVGCLLAAETIHVRRLHEYERLSGHKGVALLGGDRPHDAAGLRRNQVLHL